MGWKRDCMVFFFQAEGGVRDLVRSRGLGDVYKRQEQARNQFRYIIAVPQTLIAWIV